MCALPGLSAEGAGLVTRVGELFFMRFPVFGVPVRFFLLASTESSENLEIIVPLALGRRISRLFSSDASTLELDHNGQLSMSIGCINGGEVALIGEKMAEDVSASDVGIDCVGGGRGDCTSSGNTILESGTVRVDARFGRLRRSGFTGGYDGEVMSGAGRDLIAWIGASSS